MKYSFLKTLCILFKIIASIVLIFVLSLHKVVPMTPTMIIYDIAFAIVIFLPLVLPYKYLRKSFWRSDEYDLITLSILLFIASILIWQHWNLFGAIFKDFFN